MIKANWNNRSKRNLFIFIFTTIIFVGTANAQRDSAISYPLVTVHYGFQFPGGDMLQRFGPNSNMGVGFYYKTKHNIMCGVQWNYLFANQVKEDSLFKGVLTPEASIIDMDGKNGSYKIMERGHLFSLSLGYMFNTHQNKNSGIVTMVSLIGMQHKIRVHNNTNNIPQINNEYKQGYDHLTNGLGVGVFLGYMFMSAKNYTNFYGGFDASVGFTKNRRYNFNTSSVDNTLRYDILSGVRVGIILPLYSKNTDGKFYYE